MRKGRAAILGVWCGYSRLMSCGAWHVTCSCRWAKAVHAVARVALQRQDENQGLSLSPKIPGSMWGQRVGVASELLRLDISITSSVRFTIVTVMSRCRNTNNKASQTITCFFVVRQQRDHPNRKVMKIQQSKS